MTDQEFEQIVQKWRPGLVSAACAAAGWRRPTRTRGNGSAEEAVQEAVVSIWKAGAWCTLDESDVVALLFTAVKADAKNAVRTEVHRATVAKAAGTEYPAVVRLEQQDNRVLAEDLHRALRALPDEVFRVIDGVIREGLSQEEVAKNENVSQATVSRRLVDGKAALRAQLTAWGWEASDALGSDFARKRARRA